MGDQVSFLNSEFCVRLTMTLLHFLWQGAAIALLAAVALFLLSRASAALRYRVLVIALGMMATCPPVTFLVLAPLADGWSSVGGTAVAPGSTVPASGVAAIQVSDPRTPYAYTQSAGMLMSAGPQVQPVVVAAADLFKRSARWVATVYFAGVMIMLGRLLVALRGGRGLRHHAEPVTEPEFLAAMIRATSAMGLHLTPPMAWCGKVAVPTVVGVVKPVILLPLSLPGGLSAEQVEMLLLHELAHLRRYDHWINLVQWVLESVLFFHPAVWWVSHRIRTERELACDDMVLASGVNRTPYAESLLCMAELSRRIAGAESQALALSSHGRRFSGFGRRVLRLIEGGEAHESLRPARVWPLCMVLLALLAGFLSGALRGGAAQADDAASSAAKVNFSGGVRAELIGVAMHPEGASWWAPDGFRTLDVPQDFEKEVVSRLADQWTSSSSRIARGFYGRLTNLPKTWGANVRFRLDDPRAGTVGGTWEDQATGIHHLGFIGELPLESRRTNLHLGMAAGEWKTVGRSKGQGDSFEATADGHKVSVMFSPAATRVTTTSIVVSHNQTNLDIRVVAVDEKGAIHSPRKTNFGGTSSWFGPVMTYEFQNPPGTPITGYEFQARPFEWRKITGIQLYPGDL